VGTKERLYNQILEAKVGMDGPLWENLIGPDVKDLIQKMLAYEQDKRLTIHGVLSHPWLKVSQLFYSLVIKKIMSYVFIRIIKTNVYCRTVKTARALIFMRLYRI